MADMSKASVNARYDKIRKMVQSGKISAKEAAKLGRSMSKDYHSKGNAAQRKKDATPKPPVAKKPTAKPPASKPPVKSSTTKPKVTKPSTSHNIMSSSSSYTGTNRDKAPSTNHNIMSSSSRYTGDNLKVKPKSKPSRSSFPAGRSGAAAYNRELRAYNASKPPPKKPTTKYNRRGRPIK